MTQLVELTTSDAEKVFSKDINDNCTFLRKQRDYEAAQVKIFNKLLNFVASATVIALVGFILALLFAHDAKWALAGASAVGTIVTGVAVRFVRNLRNEHQRRQATFVTAVGKACGVG